jgi:hypothetical protein
VASPDAFLCAAVPAGVFGVLACEGGGRAGQHLGCGGQQPGLDRLDRHDVVRALGFDEVFRGDALGMHGVHRHPVTGQVQFGDQGGEFGDLAALVRYLVLGEHDPALAGGGCQKMWPRMTAIDRQLLEIVPYGDAAASVDHYWGGSAGMWFVEVAPTRLGCAAFSVGFDGADELSVMVGHTSFDLSAVQDEELDEFREIVEAVLAGRFVEAGPGCGV